MSQLVKASKRSIVTQEHLIDIVAKTLLYIALHNKGKVYMLKYKKFKRLLQWKIARYDGVNLTSKQLEKIYEMFDKLQAGRKLKDGYIIYMSASPIKIAKWLIKNKRDINVALRPVSPHLASGVHFTHQLPTPSGLRPHLRGITSQRPRGWVLDRRLPRILLWLAVSTVSKYPLINISQRLILWKMKDL